MNIQELIKAKQKSIKERKGGGLTTMKPPPGKSMFRILPGWDTENPAQFWHDYGMHWAKAEKGGKPIAVHLCEDKTFGEPCQLCIAVAEAVRAATSEEEIDLLKETNATQKYLMNVLHRNGENPDEPKVLEVGTTVFEAIAEIIGEHGDITDLNDGVDIVIKREGTGFDTKYHTMVASKRIPVDPKKISGPIMNLTDAVVQRDPVKHQMVLNTIASVIGVEAPESSAKLVGSDAKEDTSIAKALADSALEDFSEDKPEESSDEDEQLLRDLLDE